MIYSKANQFKFGVPSINFLGDTAGKDATQDHEASWTINPINNTDNTHSGILATRISSSFIAIFGQIQPSWALSRFWQVCRHLFLVQHQPFRSACPTCQRALGSPQTQSHVEIKFKDSKRWIFDLKNPDIIENHRNSWVNFRFEVSNIRMKVIDSQLRLPGLPAVGQPLYPKNFQKSRLKHLYVLRTTSTSMAGSNLLQNPKFTEKFSHQLSTQRFRRSFSCIQRWKQKFQKNHSFSKFFPSLFRRLGLLGIVSGELQSALICDGICQYTTFHIHQVVQHLIHWTEVLSPRDKNETWLQIFSSWRLHHSHFATPTSAPWFHESPQM